MCSIDYNNRNTADTFSPYYRVKGGELQSVTGRKAYNTLVMAKMLFPSQLSDSSPSTPPSTSIQNPQPNQPQTDQGQQALSVQQEAQAPQEPVARRKRTATTRRRTALAIESQVNVPSSPSGGVGTGTSGLNVPQ